MKLYLIRHAESANNAILAANGDESGRVPDPEITEIGHQQARHLGDHLAHPEGDSRQPSFADGRQGAQNYGLTHLYCSLMTRSILTAEYIAGACNLPLFAHLDIFERGGIYDVEADGSSTGLPGPGRSYFAERFPNLVVPASVGEAGWYARPAETDAQFVARTDKALRDIVGRHKDTDDSVAMVVHGDFIDQAVNGLLGLSRWTENYRTAWMGNWAAHNTSITRFDLLADAKVVVYTNRLDHLAVDLVTW